MLASRTGLSWSTRFGIVQGMAHQTAERTRKQIVLQLGLEDPS
jgi:hypothetical protein